MHLVMFTSAEGRAATHQTETLEEALKFVEHIRNSEGVGEARLFRMTEIPIEVKAYYKVELASSPSEAPPLPTLVTEEVSEAPQAATAS